MNDSHSIRPLQALAEDLRLDTQQKGGIMNLLIVASVGVIGMVCAIPLVMRWDRQQREREKHRGD